MLYINKYFKFLFTCIIFFALGCASTGKLNRSANVLQGSSLQPYGRYVIKDHQLELISSAVHFGFSFEGNECRIFTSLPNGMGHNYLQYELDGEYIKRLRIEGKDQLQILITAQGSGRHIVWIYKATEATSGPIYIERITADKLKVMPVTGGPLIEFIGNSITCGAAADASEVPCNGGEYQDHHNAYNAYGPRVARALHANYILNSVSGIGIYRNWNSEGPAMPEVYEKIDFQNNGRGSWDYAGYNPKVISIALGTNDFSNGDGVKKRLPFDSAVFVNNYISFVKRLHTMHPRSRIALLSSPVFEGNNRILLEHCLEAVKQETDRLFQSESAVALYFFRTKLAHGCSGHPSVEDHALIAEELIPFFRKLL